MQTERWSVRFLSLEISGIRAFGPESRRLDLSTADGKPASWTVLLGENGTGKTTLLECLRMFAPVETPSDDDLVDVDPIGFLNLRELAALSDGFSNKSRIKCRAAIEKLGNVATTDSVESWELGLGHIYEWSGFAEGTPGASLKVFVYCASRGVSAPHIAAEAETLPSLFSGNQLLRSPEAWILRQQLGALLTERSENGSHYSDRFALVRDIVINILPDVTDLRVNPGPVAQAQPFVEFLTGGNWLRLSALGYGYQSVLALVMDLASRLFEAYPESKNPLAEPAVVLVDELDLHLHPRWQRSLVRYLTDLFPNVQWIVTTHSPLLVQAAEGANLAVLRRDPETGHVLIENDVDAIRNWRIDQILTSDLFGLETARPPSTDSLIERKHEILQKGDLTEGDRKELRQIESELPAGESLKDREFLRLAIETLRSERNRPA